MNFVTVILPPVIYVVGFAYSIHVISDFDRCMRSSANKIDAVFDAIKDVWAPLTLTAFTTSLGFVSLSISNIESIRIFGMFAAFGTLLAWASALVVVPAGLLALPTRSMHRRNVDILTRVAPRLARFDIRHALIGFGADASHGWERTHLSSLTSVAELLTLYAQNGPVITRDQHAIGPIEGFPHQVDIDQLDHSPTSLPRPKEFLE